MTRKKTLGGWGWGVWFWCASNYYFNKKLKKIPFRSPLKLEFKVYPSYCGRSHQSNLRQAAYATSENYIPKE